MLTIEQVRELRKAKNDLLPSGELFGDCLDTLEALLWVKEEAEIMLERMKRINGPDDNCVIKDWKECENHNSIHAMTEALAPFTAKTGDRVLCSICGSKAHSDRDCKDAI